MVTLLAQSLIVFWVFIAIILVTAVAIWGGK